MGNKYKTISIIIPVYNEEQYITELLNKIIKANAFDLKKEIIIVDDRSTDKTIEYIEKFIKESREKIIFLKKKKNEGKGSAVKIGLLKSHGDIVIIQDADLEYNPDDYPFLIEPFFKYEADIVYGSRFMGNKPHRVLYFWHYMANIILTTISNMFTNLNLSDMETGYKLFKGDIIRRLAEKIESRKFGFEPEITAKIAKIKDIKIYEVGISYKGRTYKEGKKIGWGDGISALWEIFKYNIFAED